MSEDNTTTLLIRAYETMINEFEETIERKGTSINEVMTSLLQEFVDKGDTKEGYADYKFEKERGARTDYETAVMVSRVDKNLLEEFYHVATLHKITADKFSHGDDWESDILIGLIRRYINANK